ncbi:hypothetical protein [Vulcanisaeta moutnovskia]|uniref:hypothetical protein n=1 Tax=Vulcanisaeta moutnovskia TaxID=985052 RepID=UPI000A4EEDCD|nr:hypothetical protein [Vulcanisaeta moutnovskia]
MADETIKIGPEQYRSIVRAIRYVIEYKYLSSDNLVNIINEIIKYVLDRRDLLKLNDDMVKAFLDAWIDVLSKVIMNRSRISCELIHELIQAIDSNLNDTVLKDLVKVRAYSELLKFKSAIYQCINEYIQDMKDVINRVEEICNKSIDAGDAKMPVIDFIVVNVKDMDELKSIVRSYEKDLDRIRELWNKLLPRYLVGLGIINDVEGVRRYINRVNESNVVVRLMLKFLLPQVGDDIKYTGEEILNVLRNKWLNPEYEPALKKVLGLQVDCNKDCESIKVRVEECRLACMAADGDKDAFNKLINIIKEDYKNKLDRIRDKSFKTLFGRELDLIEYLEENIDIINPKAAVQAFLAQEGHVLFVLALNALIRGDMRAAEVIALTGEYVLTEDPISRSLFSKLREAITKSNNDGIKLVIAKLFYLYVDYYEQTPQK